MVGPFFALAWIDVLLSKTANVLSSVCPAFETKITRRCPSQFFNPERAAISPSTSIMISEGGVRRVASSKRAPAPESIVLVACGNQVPFGARSSLYKGALLLAIDLQDDPANIQ
jgi:hypothetical protein